ncbi:hypothetical protein BN873_150321 [Candidatus Competibacter denitrificans Run_A_D11]|uniref:Uncharacterized protein n=1 Tax=Candidatus Competibacter denitrificans Run_A_D11 TaxID=1400863 RepID=W6MBV7_9GAMM|nr:hypothetical protein BN873_150321 [Candidatus Competibacter denitrificans Run_A_D11]
MRKPQLLASCQECIKHDLRGGVRLHGRIIINVIVERFYPCFLGPGTACEKSAMDFFECPIK